MSCKPFTSVNFNLLNSELGGAGSGGAVFSSEQIDKLISTPLGRYNESEITLGVQSLKGAFVHPNTNMSDFPYLASKIKYLPINNVELAEFLFDSHYTEYDVTRMFLEYSFNSAERNLLLSQNAERTKFLQAMDDFYSENVAAAAQGGLCKAIANPFSKLNSLVGKLQGALGTLDDLLNFDLGGLLAKIDFQILAMKSMLKKVVDKVVSSVKTKLENIISSVVNLPAAIAGKMQGLVSAAKAKLSDLSVNTIKDNLDNMISSMQSQFKELTPEAIALIVFRICQSVEFIKNMLESPVQTLSAIATRSENAKVLNEAASRAELDVRSGTGINNQTYEERRRIAQKAAQVVNSDATVAPTNVQTNNVVDPAVVQVRPYIKLEATQEEKNWLNGYNALTAQNDPDIYIDSRVATMAKRATERYKSKGGSYWDDSQNMYSEDGTYDMGLEGVKSKHPEMLIMLRRVAKRLEKRLLINSAYRSPYYQKYFTSSSASPTGSLHTKGKALDVSFRGLSDREQALFVRFCSEEGFDRIARYEGSGFIHVDIRGYSTAGFDSRGRFTGGYTQERPSGGINTREAMARHINNEYQRTQSSTTTAARTNS